MYLYMSIVYIYTCTLSKDYIAAELMVFMWLHMSDIPTRTELAPAYAAAIVIFFNEKSAVPKINFHSYALQYSLPLRCNNESGSLCLLSIYI